MSTMDDLERSPWLDDHPEPEHPRGLRALVMGATGQVGRHVLATVLSEPAFTSVHEYGRRTTPNLAHRKLTQQIIDFDALETRDFVLDGEGFDVVFIALGTTRGSAGSAADFERIDRGYVLNVARAARIEGRMDQHVVYCSSLGADPESHILFLRSKGLTEQGLGALGYSTTTVFRPAFLRAPRERRRFSEVFTDPLARLSPALALPASTLGTAMARVGLLHAHAHAAGVPRAFKADRGGTRGGSTPVSPRRWEKSPDFGYTDGGPGVGGFGFGEGGGFTEEPEPARAYSLDGLQSIARSPARDTFTASTPTPVPVPVPASPHAHTRSWSTASFVSLAASLAPSLGNTSTMSSATTLPGTNTPTPTTYNSTYATPYPPPRSPSPLAFRAAPLPGGLRAVAIPGKVEKVGGTAEGDRAVEVWVVSGAEALKVGAR